MTECHSSTECILFLWLTLIRCFSYTGDELPSQITGYLRNKCVCVSGNNLRPWQVINQCTESVRLSKNRGKETYIRPIRRSTDVCGKYRWRAYEMSVMHVISKCSKWSDYVVFSIISALPVVRRAEREVAGLLAVNAGQVAGVTRAHLESKTAFRCVSQSLSTRNMREQSYRVRCRYCRFSSSKSQFSIFTPKWKGA